MGAESSGTRQTCDVLPNPEMSHTFTQRLNDSGVFGAWHKWQRGLHLVFVLHDQQVREIKAGSLNFDQHLTGSRLRGRKFFPDQSVDAGGCFTKPSMHADVSSLSWVG